MKALKKKSLSISSKYYQNVAFVSLSTFFTTIAKNDSNIMAILLLNNKKTYIHVYIIMYLSICWDSVCWTFHRRQRPSRSSTHFMIRPIGTWSTTNSQCISKYTILPTFFYCEIQQYRIILTLWIVGKVPIVVSSSDAVETITGHVLKSPKPLKAEHGERQQPATDAITGGVVSIDDNGIQRQSGFLVRRLDAKKSMAEISIPVRIRLLYQRCICCMMHKGTKGLFFAYLFSFKHGFPICPFGWYLSRMMCFLSLSFSSSSSALVLIGVSLSRECEPCLDSARRWFVESSGFSF